MDAIVLQDSFFNIILNNFLLHFYSWNQENLNFKAQKVGSTYTPENTVVFLTVYSCSGLGRVL